MSHMDAGIRILKYLKGAPGLGIFMSSKSSLVLNAYCDSDWATCPMSRRSVTGYCVTLGESWYHGRLRIRAQCLDL